MLFAISCSANRRERKRKRSRTKVFVLIAGSVEEAQIEGLRLAKTKHLREQDGYRNHVVVVGEADQKVVEEFTRLMTPPVQTRVQVVYQAPPIL